MPKKVERVAWLCNLCGSEHTTEDDAKQCEDQGWAIPEFKVFELVVIKLKNNKEIIGRILGYGPEEGIQNPHEVPYEYDVVVSERDYNPGGHRSGRHPCAMRTWPYCLRSDIVRVHIVEVGANCPICQSSKISEGVERYYNPYQQTVLGTMENVPMCHCGECGLRFFNRTQQEFVNRCAEALTKAHVKA